jgi:hypothetical protein
MNYIRLMPLRMALPKDEICSITTQKSLTEALLVPLAI